MHWRTQKNISAHLYLQIAIKTWEQKKKLKLHSKILVPQGEVKKYFMDNLLENKFNLFPPFIEAFSAGHYTTNAAEKIIILLKLIDLK